MTRHAVEVARRTGDAHIIGIALEQCARVALNDGDPAGALALVEESLAGHEAISYSEGVLASLHLLGRAELADGDPIAARERHLRALGIAVGIGHAAGTIEALDGLAAVAIALGDTPRASRLALVVESERAARRLPRRADECAMFDGLVAEATTPTPSNGVPTLAALADEILPRFAIATGVDQWGLCESGRRSSRRNSWAFSATTIVDTLIKIAPTAGESVTPTPASTPAARGMATML